MPRTELPGDDLRLLEQYCEQMWGLEDQDQVRGELHVEGLRVTVCELRAPWDGQGDWTHEPVAQLRYRPATSDWALYWVDEDSRWHEYRQGGTFAGAAADLLAEVDADTTFVFKG